ncbi:MFS transporter [Actinomyces sp. B33]|uniref:MFS transporter n=1 Tax=Actinomyces sp. B33 TaxID=2942131 RepID=UPI002341E5F4|nr:MFS transporter [Actinomyces sp. B33]MDC4232825.1 MFS transporter [Actinomyces sp. B33]
MTGGGEAAAVRGGGVDPRDRRTARQALVAALVLLGFAMLLRSPIAVVPPLLGRIGSELSMDGVGQGALTAAPVLCFGLLTPMGSAWVRRTGPDGAAVGCLGLLAVGAVARSTGGVGALFAGTILMGLAITVGNLVVPMIIGRDFARRAATMTGLYTVSTNVGVTLVTAAAVPTAAVLGWRGSSLVWVVVPILVVGLAWRRAFPPSAPGPQPPASSRSGRVWRSPVVWLLAVSFAGHTFSYFSFASWLPTMLLSLRTMTEAAAGAASSVFHLTGIVGSLVPPLLAGRFGWRPGRVLLLISGCWLSMPVGLLLADGWWPLWSALCGIGHGGLFTALFTLVIEAAPDIDVNRRIVAFVQSVGYCAAAVGPVAVGWLRASTGGWGASFLALIASLTVMTACSQVIARRPIDVSALAGEEQAP